MKMISFLEKKFQWIISWIVVHKRCIGCRKEDMRKLLSTLTVFDRPITNLIDKANNIIKMITKNEKQDLEKYDLHLSEQLSKLFLEKEDGGSNLNQEDDQK